MWKSMVNLDHSEIRSQLPPPPRGASMSLVTRRKRFLNARIVCMYNEVHTCGLHTTRCEQAPTHTGMGGVWDHALMSEERPPRPPGAPHRQLMWLCGPHRAGGRQIARTTAGRLARRGCPYGLASASWGRQGEHRDALARGRRVDPRTGSAPQPGCRRVRCRSHRCTLRR